MMLAKLSNFNVPAKHQYQTSESNTYVNSVTTDDWGVDECRPVVDDWSCDSCMEEAA